MKEKKKKKKKLQYFIKQVKAITLKYYTKL